MATSTRGKLQSATHLYKYTSTANTHFNRFCSLIAFTTPSSTIRDNFCKTLINMYTEGVMQAGNLTLLMPPIPLEIAYCYTPVFISVLQRCILQHRIKSQYIVSLLFFAQAMIKRKSYMNIKYYNILVIKKILILVH